MHPLDRKPSSGEAHSQTETADVRKNARNQIPGQRFNQPWLLLKGGLKRVGLGVALGLDDNL